MLLLPCWVGLGQKWPGLAQAKVQLTEQSLALAHSHPVERDELTGMIAAMTVESPTDGDVFLAYVEQVLCLRLQPGQMVVMDNLPAHKVEGVRRLLEAVGAELLYLPPYSPDFNPIEQAWSKIKQQLRSAKARTVETLQSAIVDALAAVTPHHAAAWFAHCGYAIQ